MSEKNEPKTLRIIISSYDVANLEEATKVISRQVKQIAQSKKKKFGGSFPLPIKRELITVPISPHKHKDSQEQLERKISRRVVEISDMTLKELEKDLKKGGELIFPASVQIRIKEISR